MAFSALVWFRLGEPGPKNQIFAVLVPEYYPFALFGLGSPYKKPNSRKKGTLIIKGLLRNLVVKT